jgi:uncharacterized membrane protein
MASISDIQKVLSTNEIAKRFVGKANYILGFGFVFAIVAIILGFVAIWVQMPDQTKKRVQGAGIGAFLLSVVVLIVGVFYSKSKVMSFKQEVDTSYKIGSEEAARVAATEEFLKETKDAAKKQILAELRRQQT